MNRRIPGEKTVKQYVDQVFRHPRRGDFIINICAEPILVFLNPIQLVLFAKSPGVYDVSLKQTAAGERNQFGSITDVQVELKICPLRRTVSLAAATLTSEP